MKHVFIYFLCLLSVGAAAQSKSDTVGYNDAMSGLPTFDRALIQWVGEYYFKGRAGRDFPDKNKLRSELATLREGLINYYVLLGRFPSALMNPHALDDTSQRRVPTQTESIAFRRLNNQTKLAWTDKGWVLLNQSQNDTCLSYTFSADSSLLAMATPNKLTIKQVKNGMIVGQPLEKIANPTYSFSIKNELYVVDQRYPAMLKRIDSTGAIRKIPLPDSLTKLSYRIDQILPDDSVVVIRRIQNGKSLVAIWNFIRKQQTFVRSLNYVVNVCHIEPVNAGIWLLAAHRADKQGYQLLLTSAGQPGSFTELLPRLVSEYHLEKQGTLVALQTDSSLVKANLLATSPSSTTTIDTNARYFDWRDNTVVYWKRLNSTRDRWGLFRYMLVTPSTPSNSPGAGFWYDTDLRRDVPRIILNANDVYFEDRSNNTANWVLLSRLPIKKD